MNLEKEIRWVGSSYDDRLAFPRDARKEAGFQLQKVQAVLEPTDWKPFNNAGAGTKEIRVRGAGGIYRVMYVAKFEEAIYVLHCFQKKSQATSTRTWRLSQSATGPWPEQGGKHMKIDTDIRHVTKPGANLFLELGFTPKEARRLQAASRQQVDHTKLLKEQLMEELSAWIAQHELKQAAAAEILMVSRPRVSDVVNKKTAKFTIDTLVEMLSRIGKPVTLAIS
jgi:phage-related protein/predicted XRE-type DNA-binding protein